MEPIRPADLVSFLRGPTLRIRVGLWLLPPALVGQEVSEAARLRVDSVDLRQPLLASLPEGTRFLGLTAERLFGLLDEVCQMPVGSDCFLVYHLDLLLARLQLGERRQLWDQLFNGFPNRKRALLLSLPQSATLLQPTERYLDDWKRAKRLAIGFPE